MNDHDFFLARSRELRANQTPAEEILWARLGNRRLDGIKFRRQHVIGRCIADFFAPEVGLVIELDGVTHVGRREVDRLRDDDLTALGLAVFRVWNTAVYEDLQCVLEGIWRKCQELRRGAKGAAPSNPSPPTEPGGEGEG